MERRPIGERRDPMTKPVWFRMIQLGQSNLRISP